MGDLAGDSEDGEPGPCTALSRATLVDQDSGEVYQVSSLVQTCCDVMLCYVEMSGWLTSVLILQFIENKRGNQRETYLMQQSGPGSPGPVSRVLTTDRHVSRELSREAQHVSREREAGWSSAVSRSLSRAASASRGEADYCSDLQLLIPDRDPQGGTCVELQTNHRQSFHNHGEAPTMLTNLPVPYDLCICNQGL